MNNGKLRALRKQARALATETGTKNINIQVRPMKSGNMVQDSNYKLVEELVPVTTYTAINKPGSYKAIYKALKKEAKS